MGEPGAVRGHEAQAEGGCERGQRAAACTSWPVKEDMALWDGRQEGWLPGVASRESQPLQSRQALSQARGESL